MILLWLIFVKKTNQFAVNDFLLNYYFLVSHTNTEEKAREREERDRAREKIYSTMVEISPLAATLKQIYLE